MNEIYWITRLDIICSSLEIVALLSGFFSAFFLIGMAVMWKETPMFVKKIFRMLFPVFLISIILRVFIPTSNEALMIYGIGGTIEHLKTSETAKQLPEKCINALDAWINDLNNKKEEK